MKSSGIHERVKNVALTFSLQGGGKYALTPKESLNCDCREGKLATPFEGVKLLNFDGTQVVCDASGIVRIGSGKVYNGEDKTYAERFFVLTEAGDFYLQKSGSTVFSPIASGLKGAGIERFADENFRYKIALIGENSCLFVKDDEDFDVAMLDGTAKTGCFFKHRMFVGMRPSKLVCSAPGDELDFTESITDGGMIRFPCVGGSIVAIKAFEDALYLFFEYGILRLTVGGQPKDFLAEKLEYAGGKIFGRTVCLGNCGIYFMAADGAYRFNGENVERLLPEFVVAPKAETLLESGAAFLGRILLRYQTEKGDRTLVVYEDGKDGFYMDELPALSGDEGGRCLFTDENGAVYQLCDHGEIGFDGRFLGAETDFGIVERKRLTKLRFEGVGSFSLTVQNGGRTFKRDLTFKDGVAEVRLSERGERFAFDFLLQKGSKIESMSAELRTLS